MALTDVEANCFWNSSHQAAVALSPGMVSGLFGQTLLGVARINAAACEK
jgi:hypothetical protein